MSCLGYLELKYPAFYHNSIYLAVLKLCSSYVCFLTLWRPQILETGSLLVIFLSLPFLPTKVGRVNWSVTWILLLWSSIMRRTPEQRRDGSSLLLAPGVSVPGGNHVVAHTLYPQQMQGVVVRLALRQSSSILVSILRPLFILSSTGMIPNFHTFFNIPFQPKYS